MVNRTDCDSFGFFLAEIDGAPAPGEFFLFLYRGFPAFVDYLPGEWLDVSVYPKGCDAYVKCGGAVRELCALWDGLHMKF